ncbi:MAG TPA: hypothetical protein DCZ69_15620 [Syntrophobacteraceae bacterium]|jgi:hypothetical protein|nr:hypothetical protein [Syntrophobacteraceae bacterium]HBD09680.1 hypothetical protein [Syntrophobacteraceae bacterium]
MLKRLLPALMALTLTVIWGCGKSSQSVTVDNPSPPHSNIHIKVVDVSNDSKTLPNVDMIGLLWDSLKEQLARDGMAWTKDSTGKPLLMEAHIVSYQRGDDVQRWLIPGFGSTRLTVRCDVKDGDQLLATVEVKRSIGFGDGIEFRAWKKIFVQVAEEVTRELRNRLRGW